MILQRIFICPFVKGLSCLTPLIVVTNLAKWSDKSPWKQNQARLNYWHAHRIISFYNTQVHLETNIQDSCTSIQKSKWETKWQWSLFEITSHHKHVAALPCKLMSEEIICSSQCTLHTEALACSTNSEMCGCYRQQLSNRSKSQQVTKVFTKMQNHWLILCIATTQTTL